MKKLLIITYYWPPGGGGGVQRWLKFVKYLRSFGWEPVVFTPENPEVPVLDHSLLEEVPEGVEIIKNRIREPYAVYKKLTGKKKEQKIQTAFLSEGKHKRSLVEEFSVWVRGNLFIPDARRFWIKPSVKMLTGYIRENRPDAIATTGPPHSTHLIGLGLKRKTGLPWLADFRDPWTNIDYYRELKLSKWADRKHHQLERLVLEQADAVTVVSPGMEKEFNAIVPGEYSVIPNGFDSEDRPPEPKKHPSDGKFSLAHIGSLTKTRNPGNLWKALHQLVEEDAGFAADLEIRNTGKMDFSAMESLKKHGLEKYLRRTDYLPHSQVVLEQGRASLLLLLINNTPNARLILTGKIFEYLVSGRPVVCIGPPDGDAAEVIRRSGCGKVYGFTEVEKLKADLLSFYRRFKKGDLKADCKNVEQFDRKNLTGDLAAVLDAIT